MASLTPGVLQKLLENVGNKDAKIVGEHRTALLQVIGIVPSLDDDPWKSRGFYLRVSDSKHSAYVSVSDSDVELILSDKIQLGQFIYVTRLDSGSPVPVLYGLKEVPRRRPCIGEPVDLISSDVLTVKKNVELKKGKKNVGMEKRLVKDSNLIGKAKKAIEIEEGNMRRLSLSNGRVDGEDTRRLSLDSVRKGWDWSMGNKNDKASGIMKSGDSSPGANIIFARKRPSPKDTASKNVNISPLRNKNVIATSPRTLSKPIAKDLKSSNHEALPDHLKKTDILAQKRLPMEDSASKHVNISPKSFSKAFMKDLKPSNHEALPDHLKKVEVNFKNWSDSKVAWDSLPTGLRDLGKGVKSQRNKSFVSAVHAMEEALAADGVIHCMSQFSELCEACEKGSPGAVVERFLNLYEHMQNSAFSVDVLVRSRSNEAKESCSSSSKLTLPEITGTLTHKTASTWVQAAIETDLSEFDLLRKDAEKTTEKGKNCFYVVLVKTGNENESESPSNKNKRSISLGNSKGKASCPSSGSRLVSTKGPNRTKEEWPMDNGLRNAATLSEKLLSFSRGWFLNYLESYLSKAFKRKGNELESETSILGHLKRVNKWLDDTMPRSGESNERITTLRTKLYGFLLDHVDTAGSQRAPEFTSGSTQKQSTLCKVDSGAKNPQ